jgi:outer membrane receptor protein involved in Fe transport
VASDLGLNGVFNASTALFRGIELTGHVSVDSAFSIDANYDVQSSQQFGEPVSVLTNNPFLLDGGQIVQIPLQKASLALNYAGPVDAQLQGYFVGNNNTLNRPAYTFFNGFVAKTISKNVRIALSANNLFNQNVSTYGYFGEQLPHQENQYQPGFIGPVQQALTSGFGSTDELLGLEGRLILFTFTYRL